MGAPGSREPGKEEREDRQGLTIDLTGDRPTAENPEEQEALERLRDLGYTAFEANPGETVALIIASRADENLRPLVRYLPENTPPTGTYRIVCDVDNLSGRRASREGTVTVSAGVIFKNPDPEGQFPEISAQMPVEPAAEEALRRYQRAFVARMYGDEKAAG